MLLLLTLLLLLLLLLLLQAGGNCCCCCCCRGGGGGCRESHGRCVTAGFVSVVHGQQLGHSRWLLWRRGVRRQRCFCAAQSPAGGSRRGHRRCRSSTLPPMPAGTRGHAPRTHTLRGAGPSWLGDAAVTARRSRYRSSRNRDRPRS